VTCDFSKNTEWSCFAPVKDGKEFKNMERKFTKNNKNTF